MKRFAKKSFVTVLALASASSSVMAADSLADAFKNGKVKGALKSYYFMENYDNASKNDNKIWANGGMLTYKTDSFNGISLGTTFQASNVTHIDDDQNKQKKSMNASGAVLSEAYLAYKFKNTKFKGGRQFISLPLIKGSGSRLIKESFEAYMITNTDISDTLISFGKVTKYQTRTDLVTKGTNAVPFLDNSANGDGSVGDFYDIGPKGNGAYSLYIQNKSINNLKVQLHYVDFKDYVKNLYVDGTYKFKTAFDPFVAVQFYNSNYEDAATEDAKFVGYKIGATFAGFKTHVSYTKADDDGSVTRGIGEAATGSFTNSTVTTKNFTKGTSTWQVGVAKKFGNFSAVTKYTKSTVKNDDANDLAQIYAGVKYNFQGSLKNLSLGLDFTDFNYGSGGEAKDKQDIRTKLIYSF